MNHSNRTTVPTAHVGFEQRDDYHNNIIVVREAFARSVLEMFVTAESPNGETTSDRTRLTKIYTYKAQKILCVGAVYTANNTAGVLGYEIDLPKTGVRFIAT